MKKLAIMLFFALISASLPAQTTKPNILLIQVDDMGFDDLSVNGNTVSHTPNIDAFSESAVRFGNFMVHSVCAPTRASLLTGRDFWRTGVSAMHGGKDFMHLDETTFAEIFKNNGYVTGMWGKWHLGKADGYWPWDRGFDEAYFANLYQYFPSNGYFNEYPKKTTHEGEWSPKVLVDYTISFIERNKQKPFLAYLSFLTCHDIWNTPDSYKNKYMAEGRTERFATLLGMLEFMDNEVGRLLQYLKNNGLDENTVVLFMSDNGPNLGDANPVEWNLRNNHGFLGNKARLWQNGLKSPLFIRWTGKYRPGNLNRLVTVTDIFPTILDMADIPLPANNLPIDGRSFKSYLHGDTTTLNEKTAVHSNWFPVWEQNQFAPVQPGDKSNFEFGNQRIALINERYKLLHNEVNVSGGPAKFNDEVLIDLISDPLERKNIAENNPEIVAEMKTGLENWFAEIKKEPHSFAPPVFQIGWKGKTSSEVLGYGPSKTVGCENTEFYVQGLGQVGDYAEYQLNVHRSGIYRVSISSSNTNMAGMELKISCRGSVAKNELTNGGWQEIGAIALEAGKNVFKIEVAGAKEGSTPEIKQLKAIWFDLETESLGLSDSLATKETALLFANLKKSGRKGIIFGQHLACYEAQNWKDTKISTEFNSDCKTAVGDHPGLFGFDFGRGITLFKPYCEEIYRRGGISTYSWHAKNPVTGKDSYDASGNPVTSILAGGTARNNWINELDKVADFFNNLEVDGVKVPIIFRPFHENTGSWFWWGTGNCTNKEFIDLWRFTIDYLRREKGVRNILIAYSPSKPSLNEALTRAMYPGDNYVDIIGFDAYQTDEELKPLIKNGARFVCNWAAEKNKVPAITEFGIRNGLQNSVSTDFFLNGFLNQVKNDEPGANVTYALTWMNTETNAYWTPLKGQPNYNSFVNFYNDSTTFFLNDLNDIYGTSVAETVDTTKTEVKMKEGLLKLKNRDGNWQWIKASDTFVDGMGFVKETGNITVDTVSSDYFTVSSVYTGAQNILKFAGGNGLELTETAWFGTGNSNPVFRIIYKSAEKVQGIFSLAVRFDGVKQELNFSVVFNASQTWDTLIVRLNTLQNYRLDTQDLSLDYFKILYPVTVTYRLNLQIKEVAFGAENLILENDKITNLRVYAKDHQNRLKVYPNPVADKVFVHLPEEKIKTIFLYNNLGQCLTKLHVAPQTQQVVFNIASYNPGIYYVRAESNFRHSAGYNAIFLKN